MFSALHGYFLGVCYIRVCMAFFHLWATTLNYLATKCVGIDLQYYPLVPCVIIIPSSDIYCLTIFWHDSSFCLMFAPDRFFVDWSVEMIFNHVAGIPFINFVRAFRHFYLLHSVTLYSLYFTPPNCHYMHCRYQEDMIEGTLLVDSAHVSWNLFSNNFQDPK